MALDPAALPVADAFPAFRMTPEAALKTVGSIITGTAGYYYLTSAQKQADFSRMVKGALLVLASLFLFF